MTHPDVLTGAKRLQVAYYGRELGPWGSAIPTWGDLTGEQQDEFITLAQGFHDAEHHHGTDSDLVARHTAETLAHMRGTGVTPRMYRSYMRRRYAEYTNHHLDGLAKR